MGKRKAIHVVPTEGEKDWGVRSEGSPRLIKKFSNKQDAIDYGREIAKKASLGQLKIHDKKGKFQTEYTYGRDPYPPKGGLKFSCIGLKLFIY